MCAGGLPPRPRRTGTRRREPAGQVNYLTTLQIFRRLLAPVRHNIEGDLVAFAKVTQTSLFDCRNMHENVLAAGVWLNEAKTLSRVEPLHGTVCHVSLLCKHAPVLNG